MLFEVNGIKLFARVQGEGEPLLLLHGFSGSSESWSPFIDNWSKKYKIIALDIIGHGRSDCPLEAERYSMEHAVDDICTLLDAMKLSKVHVLGYSMGGRLALSFAMCKPDRIDKLILESSSPGLKSAEERDIRKDQDCQLASKIEINGLDWFADYWGNIPLFQTMKRLPIAVQEHIYNQRLHQSKLGLANSLKGMGTGAQPSWWSRLNLLTVPVFLIVGELDAKFIMIAEQMDELIPFCTLEKVTNAGHNVHVEQAIRFDTIVLQYLSQ